MKNVVMTVILAALLLCTQFALARGIASTRANLNRTWDKEQAHQQKVDRDLDKLQKDGQRGLPRMYDASGQQTGSNSPARLKP